MSPMPAPPGIAGAFFSAFSAAMASVVISRPARGFRTNKKKWMQMGHPDVEGRRWMTKMGQGPVVDVDQSHSIKSMDHVNVVRTPARAGIGPLIAKEL